MKKANLTINTIVVLALVLIVFVLLLFMLAPSSKKLFGTTKSCAARGGECSSRCNIVQEISIGKTKDCPESLDCCVVLGTGDEKPTQGGGDNAY